jgi:hypothetical protein
MHLWAPLQFGIHLCRVPRATEAYRAMTPVLYRTSGRAAASSDMMMHLP